MAQVSWIKISCGILDNRKIRSIRAMPDGDTMALCWIGLLTLAGKINDGGRIYICPGLPFPTPALANELGVSAEVMARALGVFLDYGMTVEEDGCIAVADWADKQDVDKLEVIREAERARKKSYRASKSAGTQPVSGTNEKSVRDNVRDTVRDKTANVPGEIREDKIREDKIREERIEDASAPDAPPPGGKRRYGEYSNVLLSDDEYKRLAKEFPDIGERIRRLSEYVETKGAKYKSHYAVIRAWARRDKDASSGGSAAPPGQSLLDWMGTDCLDL